MLIEEFEKYSSSGSIYLLRHPEESKEKFRTLTHLGVRQAKDVAELIKEEILLAPVNVKIMIYTSELRRTYLFGEIIKRVNDSKKIGKNVGITNVEDQRLFMGPVSDDAMKVYNSYTNKLDAFLEWLKGENGKFSEVIKSRGLVDSRTFNSNINNFVRFARQKVSNQNCYIIVIGISHSWILDSWLYHYTGIKEIISTAEYTKVEFDQMYYKRKWKNL